MIVSAMICIYGLTFVLWGLIIWDMTFGVWSICIAWIRLVFMIHASFRMVPVLMKVFEIARDGMDTRTKRKYTTIFRGPGEGELRIGTCLKIREDVYGLAVVAYLKNEILDEALGFKETKAKSHALV